MNPRSSLVLVSLPSTLATLDYPLSPKSTLPIMYHAPLPVGKSDVNLVLIDYLFAGPIGGFPAMIDRGWESADQR